MVKCSTLLVIKEMQIKTETLFSASKCVTFSKNKATPAEGGAVRLLLSRTAGGDVSGWAVCVRIETLKNSHAS